MPKAMESILRGVMRYSVSEKAKFVADIHRLGSTFKPLTVFFSCMDSRVNPTRFTDSKTSEVFYVRNAGNCVPHYKQFVGGNISTEGGALELGYLINGIRNFVVCGHSDCKAMYALYDLRHSCDPKDYCVDSPLKTWITIHGKASVEKFLDAASMSMAKPGDEVKKPVVCNFQISNRNVTAKIDPGNSLCEQDILSQIHCLQQASNISSYPFLQPPLEAGELQIQAMWFDIHKGDVYVFSPKQEQFVLVGEHSLEQLCLELDSGQ